jgi:phenylacetate 2-hydroxylase
VSGGFETIPGTLTSAIGSLSTPDGQAWQDRGYEDIKRHYRSAGCVKDRCDGEESALYQRDHQEAGRYYTVSSMSLPRVSDGNQLEWGYYSAQDDGLN